MEVYSAIKGNKLLIHAATWMSLKTIMLSEKKSGTKDHMIPFL